MNESISATAPLSEVLRDKLLAVALTEHRNGGAKAHLTALQKDGTQLFFPIGETGLGGDERLDLARYVLSVESAIAYAISFRIGVQFNDGLIVERIAVFGADHWSYSAGELAVDSRDEVAVGSTILEPRTKSPYVEYQMLLDGAYKRLKPSLLSRWSGRGKNESEWQDRWKQLRLQIRWVQASDSRPPAL